MVWIRRLLPSGQMAKRVTAVVRVTNGTFELQIIAIGVTARAGNCCMRAEQRKIGRWPRVVKGRAKPSVKRMAHIAILRELTLHMIGNGSADRLRAIEVGLVTRYASGGKPLKLPDGGTLVAIIALKRGVGAEEREAVLVIFELLHRDVPALDGVALSTVRAHLALVNVGMTVLAILSHIGKNRFHVALRALHFFMHPAEGILGLVVIEFRVCADGAPGSGGVAVFARDREGTVRTSSSPLLRPFSGRGGCPGKEQKPAQNLKKGLRKCSLNMGLHTIRLGRGGR